MFATKMLNPKMKGSGLWPCKPQTGECPLNCNQCFCNREGAAYIPLSEPYIPDPNVVGEEIVRINDLNDSNIEREKVIAVALRYKNFFFNTSLPNFDLPGPVVFTANRREESKLTLVQPPDNLMYVRLRVSPTNLLLVREAVDFYTNNQVPVVLTLMAYYDMLPPGTFSHSDDKKAPRRFSAILPAAKYDIDIEAFTWKVRHINEYWSPTADWARVVTQAMKRVAGRLVSYCGCYGHGFSSNYCKDCRNCMTYYWQTIKHMQEQGWAFIENEGWKLCQ